MAYLVGALVGIALAMYPWLTSPQPYLAPLGLREWLAIAFGAAFLLQLLPAVNPVLLPLIIAGGTLGAQILVILLDLQRDPTSHNLFPFELVASSTVTLLGGGAGAGVDVAAGALRHRLQRH